MTKNTILAIFGVIVVLFGLAIAGFLLLGNHEKTIEGQSPSPTSTDVAPGEIDPDDQTDDLEAEGGDQPVINLTGWDDSVRGELTVGDAMDVSSQNITVTGIEKHYRAVHEDAPRMLAGAISKPSLDRKSTKLTFTVTIEKKTAYQVTYTQKSKALEVTTDSGKTLVTQAG